MVTFCHMRGVRVVVEQPLNSTIYRTAELSEALLMACAKRIITNLGAFGAISVKPIEIWTTLSPHALLPLVRRRTQAFKRLGTYSELCPAKRVKKTQGSKPKKYGWSKKGWVSGTYNSRQKQSSQYPLEFARVAARVVVKGLPIESSSDTRLPVPRGCCLLYTSPSPRDRSLS
eukprot:5216475-Pyramimonas_sp.AAC.1